MASRDEREGLTRSLRSQMGYGTAPSSTAAKKFTPRTRRFISRKVQRTDNLMGLALKYGVSVQDLKKENKLWNADHLFLRETLLIPLTSENESLLDHNDQIVTYNGNTASPSTSTGGQGHISNGSEPAVIDTEPATLPSSSQLSSLPGQSPRSVSDPGARVGNSAGVVKPRDSGSTSASNPMDFFSKYDTSIARLKGDIAKLESNAASGNSMGSTIPRIPSSLSNRLSIPHDLDLIESETTC